MKRFVWLSFFLILIGGFVYLLTFHRQETRDPLELVPQQTMLMLDWTDAAGATRGFLQSRFGRSLVSIDWPFVLDQLEVQGPLREQLQAQIASLLDFIEHPLFKELFSRRVVFALLPVAPAAFLDDPQGALAKNLLMVVTPEHGRVLPGILSLLSPEKGQDESLSYQGVSITEFVQENGRGLYVAFVDGQLVISPGMELLKQSIDLSFKHLFQVETGFLLNSEYKTLKERGRGLDDFFLFADFTRLKPLFKMLRPQEGTGKERSLPEFVGTERMVFFHHSIENIQQFTSIVQFDPDRLAPFQKTIYTRRPDDNNWLRNMPANSLVYFWSNWLDLPAWWQETLARGTENELAAAAGIAAWIEKQTEMSIDQFLALFGLEFGFIIPEIRTSGFFPVPSICLYIELADPEKAQELLEKMVSGLPLRRDRVAGIPVVSIMAGGGLMQPSYALLGRFLVLADSREQIEDIFRGSSKRLVSDDVFQAVDMGMLESSNLVMFARTAELIEGFKEFASWAGTIVAIRDEQAGAKSKVLLDQVILPLLDGLKMYRAKGVRSYTAPGEVVLESVVLTAEPDGDESEIR
jgi:hypothetical protein